MPASEQIEKAVIDSFISLHLEDIEGNEWVFREDILSRAQELTQAEGLLGERVGYRIGSYVLGLIGKEPGPFLQKRRYIPFEYTMIGGALESLIKNNKVEEMREPRDVRPDLRRIQYSLTYLHPIYGSPANRRR